MTGRQFVTELARRWAKWIVIVGAAWASWVVYTYITTDLWWHTAN